MKSYEVLHQNYHLQGFTTDGDHLYWSFTDSLVKTNRKNTVLAQVPVRDGHLGDIDYRDGKIYGTVLGDSLAGDPWGVWTSFFVYVFDAETLVLQKTIRLDPCYRMYRAPEKNAGFCGVDGIAAVPDGTLWLAGGLYTGEAYDRQMLLHISMRGELLDIRYFSTGNTPFGIQNLDYEEDTGRFWFSTYLAEKPYQAKASLYCADGRDIVEAYEFCTPYGFHALGGGRYLASAQAGVNGNRQGYAYEIGREDLANGPRTEADAIDYMKKRDFGKDVIL